MKKFLLTLVCLVACLPFVNAAVIEVNSQKPFTNNIRQVEEDGQYKPSLKVWFLDSDKGVKNNVTGIVNPTGATFIAPDGTEIRSTSMTMFTDKMHSFAPESTGVQIDFPYFPVTSKDYKLIIDEGTLQFGSDINAEVVCPRPYDTATEGTIDGTFTPPIEACGEKPADPLEFDPLSISFASKVLQNGLNVTFAIRWNNSQTNTNVQFVELSRVSVKQGDKEIGVIAAQPADFVYNTVNQRSFRITLAEPVSGQVTVSLEKGALIMLDMDGSFGNKVRDKSYTNAAMEQTITLEDVGLSTSYIHCDGSYFVQNNTNISFAVFSGETGTTSADIISLDASKISVSGDNGTIGISKANIRTNILFEGGAIFNGLSLVLEEMIPGSYSVKIEEGALILADGSVNKTCSLNILLMGEALVELYWPENGEGYVQRYPEQDSRLMFAFSTTDPANSKYLAKLGTEKPSADIINRFGFGIKDAEGNIVTISNVYRGSNAITVGETSVPPIVIAFESELPNGKYTLDIDKGAIIFADGTPNAHFNADFVWADAMDVYEAPTFSYPAGNYPSGTYITITAGEGGFVKYRFTPDYQAPSPDDDEGDGTGDTGETGWTMTGKSSSNFYLTEAGLLEATTYGEDGVESEVTTAHYGIGEMTFNTTPIFSLPTGDVKKDQVMTISTERGSIAYRFIADDSTEEVEWERTGKSYVSYSFETSGTLEAFSYSNTAADSEIIRAHYSVIEQWEKPVADPASWSEVEFGTKVTVTAEEGAYLAYKVLESGGNEYRPARAPELDEEGFTLSGENTYEFEVFEATAIQFYAYGEGKANSDILYGSWTIAVPKLPEPTFEPAAPYTFEINEGDAPAQVVITSPEGTKINYQVRYNEDGYYDYITSETNTVTVTLNGSASIWAYTTNGDWTTDSPIVKGLYTVVSVSVDEIIADFGGNAEVYTLKGVRVSNSENLEPGVYVVVKEGKATKILVK